MISRASESLSIGRKDFSTRFKAIAIREAILLARPREETGESGSTEVDRREEDPSREELQEEVSERSDSREDVE